MQKSSEQGLRILRKRREKGSNAEGEGEEDEAEGQRCKVAEDKTL